MSTLCHNVSHCATLCRHCATMCHTVCHTVCRGRVFIAILAHTSLGSLFTQLAACQPPLFPPSPTTLYSLSMRNEHTTRPWLQCAFFVNEPTNASCISRAISSLIDREINSTWRTLYFVVFRSTGDVPSVIRMVELACNKRPRRSNLSKSTRTLLRVRTLAAAPNIEHEHSMHLRMRRQSSSFSHE